VDDLPTWVRWIIVAGIGLSPILTFWIASVLGRFRRRKLWSRAQTGAADVPIARRRPARMRPSIGGLTGLLSRDVCGGHRSLRQGAAAGRFADHLGARSPTQ
jgi:hypothetical protein